MVTSQNFAPIYDFFCYELVQIGRDQQILKLSSLNLGGV